MLNDPLANMMSNILSAVKSGKSTCGAAPSSKLILAVLEIMQRCGYAGKYELRETGRGGALVINLLGSINKCGAIKPRFSVKKDNYEKFEKRFLPAKDFGFLIVSTSKGVMTHTEAKEKKLGGRLLAYIY